MTTPADATADPERETALFYVCSEALANAIKHAGATRISIDLRRNRGDLVITIVDDGIGGAQVSGSGLRGLADRLAAFGGRLRVDSPPGAGATLRATIRLVDPRPGAISYCSPSGSPPWLLNVNSSPVSDRSSQ